MKGILRCSRYSFGPNRLHYCGPDKNSELRSYIESGETDPNLAVLLKQFKTLYPYLSEIARANNIRDPFDERVVEAYWLGNNLLETEEKRKFREFLVSGLEVKKKMTGRNFEWMENKISGGALPHHSFHVLNVWRETSKEKVAQDVKSLGECIITSGIITKISGPEITVMTELLIYTGGKFSMSAPVPKILIRELQAEYDIEQLEVGQIVSIHWSVPCEVITKEQAAALKKYTLKSIELANQTV